jgi:hypothetical protein
LIQYNFETRSPDEINWYLKNRVGCTRTTIDGSNYRFSSTDKPGIVYLPGVAAARAMQNMNYGKYGIRIAGGDEYQQQVKATLDWISRSDTGMVLLQGLQRTGKSITITAWEGSQCNATAGPTSWTDATADSMPVMAGWRVATENSLVRNLLGLPQEPLSGTGLGSDVIVSFSPTMWGHGSSGPCSGYAGMPGSSPSQVLFHELAHAYRQARGLMFRRPTVGGSAGYDDMEEFFAVVLSNVLITDPTYSCGNRTLRADHTGFQPLAPTLCTSHGFVSNSANRRMLSELVASDPELTAKLKSLGSTFNPFGSVSP